MRILIIILTLFLVFSGCEKEKHLKLCGKWVLIDGNLLVQDMQTGKLTKYHHFGDGKTISQLTGFNKTTFPIETIELNKTTWEFCSNNDFILNGDYDRPMYINKMGEWLTIIEHPTSGISMLGGSARPFTPYTYDYDNQILVIRIQLQVGSYQGHNIEWDNELFFQRVNE